MDLHDAFSLHCDTAFFFAELGRQPWIDPSSAALSPRFLKRDFVLGSFSPCLFPFWLFLMYPSIFPFPEVYPRASAKRLSGLSCL